MEEQKDICGMLDLIMQPAFCVENGIIVQLNKAAAQLLIAPETPIAKLLPSDSQEYEQFRSGCLYLNLIHGGQPLSVSVTRVNESDVFVVESGTDEIELRAMALAAMGIRQPLSDMITTANRLFPMAQSIDDPSAKMHIAQMNQGLYQLHRIACNMTDAARFSGGQSSNMVCQDICSVTQEIFERAAELISHCGITLQYSVPTESILCMIDDQLLERAVYNMISNAVKFNEADSKIRASLTRRRNKLYLCVEDLGNGIPRDLLGSVFNRFQRQPGLEDSRFGIGLGLVLVRSAAHVHGGAVLIDQPEGVGTRITLSIAINQGRGATVRSNPLQIDYAGERDHGLVELSDILPCELYENAF